MSCPVPPRAFTSTCHFLERRARIQLRDDVLDFILEFGARARAAGMTHVTVLERDLPAVWRSSSLARQARGWIVLLSDEERLITCYRRGDASRFIRRKPKHRMSRRVSGAQVLRA
ncbi:hypothetical protein JY651_03995 [Pyxidicoccus parkwayensis]|uniref:DUF4258 domain-containing protein n=1 Tax=Pyxidicoccus parkwayensis TaxID=2813578 RepID=A0ABX7P1V9_9BACT|nr:hypothetical protein [Pyxidicoccus parkwaysis]QSQ24145.1 hypothetical protein JY651_03995 [Pyxidicoccus parkwaysis]